MAKNNSEQTDNPLLSIEKLAELHGIPDWMFAGMKAAYVWGAGKEMTEKDFLEARDKWLSGPMCKGVK